jgi:thiol-disulfide isomerase/thioredoxin
MSSSSSANEPSPGKTYRLMAIFAVAIILLLTVAIYSLSKMETAPWASPLAELRIQDTFRKNLPQFEYMDGNNKLTPQNFQGKWTLLSFWSYSCPPCLAEMPSLNQMALNWSGPELAVVTVNVDDENSENFELAKSFLQDEGIVLPTIFDKQKILTNAFAVQVYPKHFLINPKGEMIWEAQGSYDWDSSQSRDNLVKLIEQQTPETVQDLAE